MSSLSLSSQDDQLRSSVDQIEMTSTVSGDPTKRFISDELRAKVLGLKDKILLFREIPKKGEILDPVFEILQRGNNTVFKITGIANYVFKLGNAGSRYANYKTALEVLKDKQLTHLVLPKTELIVTDEMALVVEEALEFNSNESQQKALWQSDDPSFLKSVRDLAIFIQETRFYDVSQRNIPVLKDQKIGLIDIEHLDGSQLDGVLGHWNGSCGLIKCVGKAGLSIIQELYPPSKYPRAKEHLEAALAIRGKELHRLDQLKSFYQKHQTTPLATLEGALDHFSKNERELIEDDWERDEEIPYERIIQKFVDAVNKKITTCDPAEEFTSRRKVIFKMSGQPRGFGELTVLSRYYYAQHPQTEQKVIFFIAQRLMDKELIFDWTYDETYNDLIIQA